MIIFLQSLNLLSIALAFLFQLILIRFFGASENTDVFFLATAIIQFVGGILNGFLMDLFVPIYNEVKVESDREARRFVGAMVVLSGILSVAAAMLIYLASPLLVQMFASGFSESKRELATMAVRLLSVSIPFTTLMLLFNNTLNAHLTMSVTYWTNLLNPLFGICGVLVLAPSWGLAGILAAVVSASVVGACTLLFYASHRIPWSLSNPLQVSAVRRLLQQNVPVRVGSIVYSLRGLITTNVLSFFPTGSLTLFSYADKMLQTMFSATNSPVLQILYMKASSFLARSRTHDLVQLLKTTVRSNLALLVTVLLPATMLLDPVLTLLLGPKVTHEEIRTIILLFLSLIPFYLVLAFELPFVNITLAMKRGRKILQIALIFIVLYSVLLALGVRSFGLYALPAALLVAQMQNTVSYALIVQRSIPSLERDVQIDIAKVSLFVVLFLGVNIALSLEGISLFYANGIALVAWVLVAGKQTLASLRFIAARGEIG